MKSSGQFNQIFIPHPPSPISLLSPRYRPIATRSPYFQAIPNSKSPNLPYSPALIYFDKTPSTQNSTERSSLVFETGIERKLSSVLERSRSQILQPNQVSPYKKEPVQVLNKNSYLTLSKNSQVTFANSNKFIKNSQNQIFCADKPEKNLISSRQLLKNDYGYQCNNIYFNKPIRNDCILRVASPIKQSFLANNSNSCRNSFIVSRDKVSNPYKLMENHMIQGKKITPKELKTTVIFKNKSSDYGIAPQLRRALSNVSIISGSCRNSSSGTKVNFNYISPSKSEQKMVRKLSFRKEDVRNPLNKLARKKQCSRNKLERSPQNKINKPEYIFKSQAVNEYFPEFKVKRNKIKDVVSPLKNSISPLKNAIFPSERLSIHKNVQPKESEKSSLHDPVDQAIPQIKIFHPKSSNKSNQQIQFDHKNYLSPKTIGENNEIQEDEEKRNNTFINGLEQDVKMKERQQSTQIETPKKNMMIEFKRCVTGGKNKPPNLLQKRYNQMQHENKALAYHPVPQTDQQFQFPAATINRDPHQHKQSHQQISKISRELEVSVDSLKHGEQLQFLKKDRNDSEYTTDYEEEIVRKLKQELGLNYSYHKQ